MQSNLGQVADMPSSNPELSAYVNELMKNFNSREQEMLVMRSHGVTYREMAEQFGISAQRCNQLILAAQKRLGRKLKIYTRKAKKSVDKL